MKIGDIQIDSLIDADTAVAAESTYPNVDAAGLTPHNHYLHPCTGDLINALGHQELLR